MLLYVHRDRTDYKGSRTSASTFTQFLSSAFTDHIVVSLYPAVKVGYGHLNVVIIWNPDHTTEISVTRKLTDNNFARHLVIMIAG